MAALGTTVVLAFALVYSAGLTGAGPTGRLLEGFTLDEVLSGKYYAESFNGTWISGKNVILSNLIDNSLLYYRCRH